MLRLLALFTLVAFMGCSADDTAVNEYTGNEISYSLFSGSEIGTAGEVTFKERTDRTVDIIVTLDNRYQGNYPVHLHYCDLSIPDAPQATLLADYDGEKNISMTNLSLLADETPFTFDRVDGFNGSVKIRLGRTGPDYDVLISAGNIGSNVSKGFNLEGIANCSEDFEF